MANIFLSYAREDDGKAARVAAALESAGHDVWWDREIGAGASFSSAIDAALENAELIVVLWSAHSIKSDWVRDEAAIGRDSGRLVPALIDQVLPPLGFRQYQSVEIPARRSVNPLVKAIEHKLAGPAAKHSTTADTKVWSTHRRTMTIAACILLLLGAGLAGWWLLRPTGLSHTIAVVPAANSGAGSIDLARSVARDLGQLRAGPIGMLTIVDPAAGDPREAEFRMELAQSGAGKDLRADIAMTQRGARGLLWSSVVEEPGGRTVDLRLQVSAQIGEVLNCLAELGDLRRSIRSESLSLYLRGCSLGDSTEAIAVFRQLTEREPKFGPGWANLALVSAWLVPAAAGSSERRALVDLSQAAREKAKQYGPDLPETAVAVAITRPGSGTNDGLILRSVDDALVKHPDSALLRGTRADVLQALGRMKEAIAESGRAKDLNPLSPSLLDLNVSALAYAGNVETAYSALAEAEKAWPGSSRLAQARFRLDLRYGNPERAADYYRKTAINAGTSVDAVLTFLDARKNPTAANIEAAIDTLRGPYQRNPAEIPAYLQALVMFDRIDEAFQSLEPDLAADSVASGPDILFRSYMAKLRADPRFIRFAKRIGLVDVWQQTGVWPDFCAEPSLPYDCRAEAAKVRNVRPLQPITE